ncbi:MAG: O-antigen ligase family protein [Patescibacteria group bacterium]
MKHAARWTAIIALFAIPFLPLYVSNDLYFPFITGKGFAFRVLVEIALVSYVVLAFLDRRYRPRFSWTLALFTGLVAWMAVANLLGVNPHKAFWSNFERMDGWVMLVHVYALFIVASSVLSVEKLWRRWWQYFIGIAAFVCGYGLLQLIGGAEIHQGGVRVDASFGNAIYLAVYLMFSILVAGWLMIESRGWYRYALGAFSVLAFIVLFFTASRGALIGLVAGAGAASVLWIVLSLRGGAKGAGTLGLRIAGGSLIVLVVLVSSFFLARDSAFVQNEPALARLATVFSLNEELKVRSTIWGIAFKGVQEDPVTGWGQEGFNQVFNKHYVPSLFEQETWFDRAHSTYLDWLIAGGFPALILFIALLLAAFIALLRAPDLSRAERVLLIGALAAYAVQALVVFDNLFSYVPFAILLAMAHRASEKPINVLERAPELSGQTGVSALGTVAAVAAIALVWVVNVPGMSAAHHLVYAVSPLPQGAQQNLEYFKKALADNSFATQEIREQIVINTMKFVSDEKVPEGVRQEYATLALLEMGKEIERSPNDARLRVQYASAYEAAGDKESSLLEVEKAIELSPKKQALHINRGFKLFELGRLEEAREAFRYAYDLDPSFEQVAVSAASGYVLAGDLAGAKALLMEALGTTTADSDSLFYAYYQTKQWDDMIAVARARVAAANGSADSRLRLGQALAAAGRFAEARAEILATITAFPEARESGQALLNQIPGA